MTTRTFTFTVQAASGLPSWVPSPGTFADVSLNLPDDVRAANVGQYRTSGPAGAFTLWTSGVFAPDLGAAGSYVCWGGGHQGYDGNEVYRWDVSTRLWSRMGDPSPYSQASTPVDSTGAFPDGNPAPPHSYHTLGIRSSANGGGASGSLIQATQPALDDNGNGRMTSWWAFNLATSTWSRFLDSSAIPAGTLSMKTMVQEPQSDGGAFWWFGGGNTNFVTKVTQAGAVAFQRNVGYNSGSYVSGGVIPGTRCAILHGTFSLLQTRLFNLATIESGGSSNVALTTTGTAPSGDGSLTWCPDRNAFASLVGSSPTTVRWLTPSNPANPSGSTWAWTAETFTPASGTTSAPGQNGDHGRFVWVPAIKCFLWASSLTRKMQAYRPAGA